jgi:hypothetical protein
MRRLAAVIALLAALVPATPAAAKGPVDVDLCGLSDCKRFRWSPHSGENGEVVIGLLNTDSMELASSPTPGPYYRLQTKADWLEQTTLESTFFYVPAANTLRAGSNWLRPDRKLSVALAAATRGLEPFPRPKLTRVLVNGRPAPNPAAYEALLGALPQGNVVPDLGRRIEIVVRSSRPSPWTSAPRPLEYFPRFNLLHRQVEWFSVSPPLAEQIEDDARIGAPAGPSRSAWPGYLAAILLGLGLVAVVALNQRSRRRVRRDAEQAHAAERPPEPAA